MGTNYYAKIDICKTCQKPDYSLHIGKSSSGWPFGFRAYTDKYDLDELPEHFGRIISDIDDWQRIIADSRVEIFDEYGEKCDKKDFWDHVNEKQKKYKDEPYVNDGRDFKDHKGYFFSVGEFF